MKNFSRIWIVSLIVKFFLAALIPLSADEAYYWVWSQKPQLSYFDHPPLVSWLFSLGHFLEPFMNAVRWPAVLLGHGIILIWYFILHNQLTADKFKIWIYLVLFSPLLGFGSLIVTPDLPVLFFWSLSLCFLIKALEERKLFNYALLGISLGLGFCSKYHIVIFVPCLIAYLTIEKKWPLVIWKGVLLTVLMGLIGSSPVLIWNIQNNFASFEFQLRHGLETKQYSPDWTLSYILGQILILFPTIIWASLRVKLTHSLKYLKYFGWGPLLFFFLTSFRALVEANWPIIGYPAIIAIAIFHPNITKYLKSYLILWGLVTTTVLATLFIPQLRRINYKIEEPYLLQQLSPLALEYKPLYAGSYQLASSLWYFSKTPVFKLRGISRFDFFDTLPESMPASDHFYLLRHQSSGLPEWIAEQRWKVKEIKKIEPELLLMEFKRP